MVERFEYDSIQKSFEGITGGVNISSNGDCIAKVGFHASNEGIIEIGPSGGEAFVDFAHQKRGLGKRVCEEALKVAKEQLIKNRYRPVKAIGVTAEWNTPAQHLVKSLGYKLSSEDYLDNTQMYELIL